MIWIKRIAVIALAAALTAPMLPRGAAAFWKSLGVSFRAPDQTEIDLLMPVGSSVLVSEM